MPRYPGFIGSSYQAQSVIADTERTVNFYVEQFESQGAKNALALYPVPGFAAFNPTVTPKIGARGALYAAGRLFLVIADGLYEFYADGTWTLRGTVTQDNHPATLSYNGTGGGQLFITSGTNGYCYALDTNTLTQVLTGEATMGAFAANRFLALNVTTGKVRMSNVDDGLTWDPTLFFERSQFADPWQALFVDGQGLIWLPGTETYEAWYVTSSATNPFAPLSGLNGRYGIASSWAWGLAGKQILWLATNKEGATVVSTAQGGGEAISTYAVDAALATYQRTASISDAECLVHHEQGHTFVVFAFPSVPATWAYDVEGQSWTERGKWNSATGSYDLWSPRVHAYAFGKHLVGDRTSGQIAIMDATYATELDGSGIRRLRRAPGFTHEHWRLPYDQLELLMDVGLGTQTGQGIDPQVVLRTSRDGGRTWGTERRASFGRAGEYRRRVYWLQLGVLEDAVFEVTITDPVPSRIIDAWINNAEGMRAA